MSKDLSRVEEIVSILQSHWVERGSAIEAFEAEVAAYCGAKYAVAVNSGTSALHIACLAFGLKAGDSLWTSPNTFVASANCALYCDAKVDFIDIELETYNFDLDLLEEKLIAAKKTNTLPKLVLPVHFAGQSCDMQRLSNLSKKYGFKIIEDASHALGGVYQNHKIGSGEFSDLTIFSFHPFKLISTGEGGMAVTNDKNIYEKLKLLRSHGITRDKSQMQGSIDGPWVYQQLELGYNYRITDIQAILGLSQVKKIDSFIKSRNETAIYFNENLKDLPLKLPSVKNKITSAWHLYVVMLELDNLKKSRLEIFNELKEEGLGVNVNYIPVYSQPFYRKNGFSNTCYEKTEFYYERAISLHLQNDLTKSEKESIVYKIKAVLLASEKT